jgi:hypothetical protein
MTMVSLRKPLHLATTTAGLPAGEQVMSRDTATATPAEVVTIRDSSDNEDGPNSNAGSLHRESSVEPQGKLNDNEAENREASAQSSIESKNATLLRCVKVLEEHNQLLERIWQLEEEQNIIVKRIQPLSFASPQPSNYGPQFEKHTLEY